MKTFKLTTRLSRVSTMLAALLLTMIGLDANASITVTKLNTTGASVNGASVNQTVSFSAADFAGAGPIITEATVQIAFSKMGVLGVLPPNFNEVGFTLTSANGVSVALIRNQNSGTSSFNAGGLLTTYSGSVTFDQTAAQAVNADPDQIQSGTFRPDNGNLDTLLGGDAIGTWTLNISDSDGTFGASTPLTVSSWSVTVTTVPEPDSIALWSMAGILAGIIVFHRPRRRNEADVRVENGLQPG